MEEKSDSLGQETLTLDSDLEELERLRAFIDGFCDREHVPDETHYHLNIALEELVINAIKHGGSEAKGGAIRVTMRMEGGDVQITLSDTGVGFNPLQAPAPELSEDVRHRPIGGLGIHLVRCLMPAIRYERHEGRNYLYITKPLKHVCQEEDADASGNGDHPR